MDRPARTYAAWLMAALAFVVQAVGSGNQYMTVLLLGPLRDRLHTNTASISFATTSVLTGAVALFSPLGGMFFHRFSLRNGLTASALAVALGYLALAYAQSLLEVILIYSSLFAAGAIASAIGGNALVTNWFDRGRGVALGVAGAGIPAAGLVIPPFVERIAATGGIESACLIFAGIIAALSLSMLLINDSPSVREKARDQSRAGRDTKDSLKQILRSAEFWRISIIGAVSSGVGSFLMMFLVELAVAQGFDRQAAAQFVCVQAAGAIIGSVFAGLFFDRMSERAIYLSAIIITIISCLLLLGSHSFHQFALASLIIGIGLGASLLAPNVVTAEYFGATHFSIATGAMNFVIMIFLVVGMPAFGWFYDTFQSYTLAIWLCVVILMLIVPIATTKSGLSTFALDR